MTFPQHSGCGRFLAWDCKATPPQFRPAARLFTRQIVKGCALFKEGVSNKALRRMQINGHSVRLVLAASLSVLGAATVVLANDVTFELSDGRTLELPTLGEIDCAQAREVLNRIDSTGYRPIGPSAPEHPKDRALYDYEGRVSDKARHCDGGGGGMDFRFGIGFGKSN